MAASHGPHILEWARRVQAIAQTGLAYCRDEYDRQRYRQLQELVAELLSTELGLTTAQIRDIWRYEGGYVTPKVDVRGAVFDAETVLLVRERSDGGWTLPGGWADVNDTPSQAVEREIHEESGYRARAVKLAAVYDRNRHPHPPTAHHAYKLFFLCELVGGEARTSCETDGVGFFPIDRLPTLSTSRVTRSQIVRLFEHYRSRDLPTDFD